MNQCQCPKLPQLHERQHLVARARAGLNAQKVVELSQVAVLALRAYITRRNAGRKRMYLFHSCIVSLQAAVVHAKRCA